MSKIYQLNVQKLALLLCPTFLRKSKSAAWLKGLLKPLDTLHYRFSQHRQADLYKLSHNSQVCYLQKALNDDFDNEKRRIRILDGNKYKRNYIYTRAEAKPKFLGTMYLRNREDYADTGVDFVVEVPKETFDEYKMKALINFYKLAGKRYTIIIGH